MSSTGVDSLDRSIDKAKRIAGGYRIRFGTGDCRVAYRVTRRLSSRTAAHNGFER